MNSNTKTAVAFCTVFITGIAIQPIQAATSAAGWSVTNSRQINNLTRLRGYGPVTGTLCDFKDATTDLTVVVARFEAVDQTHALTIVSKFLADLTLSPDVTVSTLAASGHQYRLVRVAGGAQYTGCVVDRQGYILSAENVDELARALRAWPALIGAQVVTDVTRYPMYLDRFDRYGWGFYSFADADNGWGSNVIDDENWCAKNGYRYELYIQPGGYNGESFGISDIPQTRWKVDEAKRRHLAVSAHLYGAMPWSPEYSDGTEYQAPFLETGWYNWSYDCKTQPHMSWLSPEGRAYYARQTGEQMQLLVNEPNLTSWLSPFAENGGDFWYCFNGDFSPAATANWREYLQTQGHVSLPELSKMYNRPDNDPFTSWDQVTVPEYATFAGLSRQVADLAGAWHVRYEPKLDDGIAGQWWNADVTTSDWTTLTMPGSDLFRQFDKPAGGNNPNQTNKWCIRDFRLSADQLATTPIFLYTFLRVDAGNDPVPAPIYVNGHFTGDASGWDAMDVTSLLKPGLNRLALRTDVFNGRVFLSTEPPQYFPHFNPDRNRLWIIWRDWYYKGMFDATRETFDVMRQVDPNRPIKCMAPEGYGVSNFFTLAEHYGGLGHFTGEGVWMFPWEKRVGYLYNVPGSSEGAGPCNNETDCFRMMDRVFLEGNNGHEDVFEAQNYIDSPLRTWYENHTAVLRQLGRYDLSGPQVVLYRSTISWLYGAAGVPAHAPEQDRYIQGVYDWDIGRGAAQASGQSCIYLEDGSLKEGRLNPYKIMVDCGNDQVDTSCLPIIKKWVENGGTYVIWPFTGRATLTNTEAWPITSLTGCGIGKLRTPGSGTVTILKDQPYLRALAGQTFPDDGKSTNSAPMQVNNLSVELKPGPGSEVIARFEDGAPAIVVQHIGKGRIVILGSAFFRNSKDVLGIWWPEQNEIDFWTDLFKGLGQPSCNTTNDIRVWPQRYRMNNGVDDVVVLNNFANADRVVTLTATLDHAPAAVYAVRMNAITPIPFSVAGRSVTVADIAIPKDEVQVYLFRTHGSDDAIEHWWTYQQKMWHAISPITSPALPKPLLHWSDPAVDLTHGWRWTQAVAPGADWTGAAVNDSRWPRYDLDVMNFAGVDPSKPVYMRRHFVVPSQWLHDSAVTRLIQGADYLQGTTVQISLNGKLIRDYAGSNFEADVSSMLHAGDNVLAVALKPGKGPYIGISGSTFLSREPAPAQVIDLAGTYQNHDPNGPPTITLPGSATAVYPTRTLFVPADWKGKYIVTCCVTGADSPPGGVYVNEHCVRSFGSIRKDVEFDITHELNYGADNIISPAPYYQALLDSVHMNFTKVELRLYPKMEFEKFASTVGMVKPLETAPGDLP